MNIPSTREAEIERRAIYDDVEGLLVPGFLSTPIAIGDTQCAMKSLFPGEMFVLRNRLGTALSDRAWREWAVASSVWMVGGQVLLEDVNAAVRIRATLRELSNAALDKLFSVYTSLYNRVQKAITRVEAYCYEDFGRAAWRMAGRVSPARVEVAGIPGVTSLGMNHVQRLWVAFNLAEDDRLAWNLEWSAAKFTASATAPKGVQRLNQRDESERKLEEERRRAVINNVYFDASGRRVEEANGLTVYRAVSADELSEEMERWARGERDSHDAVIEAYRSQIRERHDQERRAHEERMEALSALQEEAAQNGVAPLVGYTKEQLQALRGEVDTSRRVVYDDSSKATHVFDKYIQSEIQVGGLADGGKAKALPKKGESLDTVLAGRKVHLSDDGGS